MKWSEVCIHTTNEAIESISNILHEHGANGVAIENSLDLTKEHETLFGEIHELNPEEYPEEGVFIKTYLPVNSLLTETVENIEQAIQQLPLYQIDIGANRLTMSEVNEEDWANAWKKYYKPVKVSKRITITPTWEEYQPVSAGELVIELDPGMAFGTGTHPTTILSMQALERYVQEGDVILDVGCGSGVLSIASILLGADTVHAYDLDEIAVNSTEYNARLNKVSGKIHPEQNNLLEHVHIKCDIIVSNILAEIIVQLIPNAWKNLKQEGVFITSGIIRDKNDLVRNQLIQNGFEIIGTGEMEGWISIIAKKAGA